MKVKTVIISLLVAAGAVGGIAYGVRYSIQSQKKPVEVVPVRNVNFSYWGDNDTMSGTIISKDTQTVRLSSEHTLTKVYVKEGDEVKVGDPLLEYDMTMTELQREMEDLTRQTLELNMKSLERELEKWKKLSPTASLEIDTGIMTASAEDSISEEEVTSGYAADADDSTDGSNPSILDDDQEDDSPIESDPGQNETNRETDVPSSEQPGTDASLFDDDEGLIEDDDIISTDSGTVNSADTIRFVNEFLTRINQLPQPEEDLKGLYGFDIDEALKLFRQRLAVSETTQIDKDVLGEKRTRTIYSLNPQIAALVGENTAKVLQQCYERACVYRLIYCLNLIDPGERSVGDLSDEEILAQEEQIREAVEAYYEIQGDAFEDYKEVLSPYTELLGEQVVRLNNVKVVEEPESSTEWLDDLPDDDFDDYGDFGGDDGESYTAQEIKEAIEGVENDIKDCQLDIRESELKLKQYDRELGKKIVKSTMNGVVKSAGTVNESVAEDEFIVITGASGMYVQGTISELKLDTVSIGDTVQGVSYDTGMSFTATITEISEYPTSNNDYWSYSSESANASSYPFLAYIEDVDGLSEGDVELQIVDSTPSAGIYLENYYVRTENGNKNYVYIQGEDGMLKKQYVVTGKSIYGWAVEIKSGLSLDDNIAFPYGKSVAEGAATIEVDNLDSDDVF